MAKEESAMRKAYAKPLLVKRALLPSVTADIGSPPLSPVMM